MGFLCWVFVNSWQRGPFISLDGGLVVGLDLSDWTRYLAWLGIWRWSMGVGREGKGVVVGREGKVVDGIRLTCGKTSDLDVWRLGL